MVKEFPPSIGGVQQYTFHYVQNMPHGSCIVLTKKQSNRKDANEIERRLLLKGQKLYKISSIPESLNILSAFRHPLIFSSFCKTLLKVINKEKITHIIFAHPSFYYFFASLLLNTFNRFPCICIFHGEDIPVIPLKSNGLFRWLISRLDLCVCNSYFTYNRLKNFLRKEPKYFVAYPGVEDNYFQKLDKNECKKKFRVSDKKVIYTIGRLDERKGHDLVIKALPDIIEKIPDVIYLIAGEGTYFQKLKSLVDYHNLNGYVKFCGFIEENEIRAFHGCGDVFVMPNRILTDGDTEGFGMVFIEASAACNPVIAGKAGGAIDAVVDGLTGFLVNSYASDEFIEKVIFLLTSPDVSHKLGLTGRNRAFNSFQWASLADTFIKNIEGINP